MVAGKDPDGKLFSVKNKVKKLKTELIDLKFRAG
jgi:hypothetical protein